MHPARPGARAPGRAPGDRRRERRHPRGGTPGYTESVDYVVDTLEAAGWNVTLDEFPFTFIPPPTLQQLTPVAATYETGAFTGTRVWGRHRAT